MRIREEMPTLALLAACYGTVAVLTVWADALTLPLAILLLAPVVALHSSLQHEALHGHPFADPRLNAALVFPAIGLFIPYLRFKDMHLAHHHDPNLTDPYEDPESNFLDPAVWNALPGWRRGILRLNNTLLGRMLVGPALSLANLYATDLALMARGDRRTLLFHAQNAGGVALVLLWLSSAATMPLWAYAISAYLGLSIIKVRTYLEHRAEERAAARSVIIEDRGIMALLFLNNNYHSVHHANPDVAWHRLPGLFERNREKFLRRNGGYIYRSYWEIFARHLFRAKDPVPHPLMEFMNRRIRRG